MTTPEQTLAFLQAGFNDLEEYLLSELLYWPLTKHNELQRLTIGGLLLELTRFQAGADSPQESSQYDRFSSRLDTIKSKRQSAWEAKTRQELKARMTLWKTYLGDYYQDPEGQAEYFPREVKWRVLLQLLIDDIGAPIEDIRLLEELDKMVKSAWLPGDFVWELYLVPAFQTPEYWFLYGRLK